MAAHASELPKPASCCVSASCAATDAALIDRLQSVTAPPPGRQSAAVRRSWEAAQRDWAQAFAQLAANRGIRARFLGTAAIGGRSAGNISDLAQEVGVSKSTAYARLRLLADDGGAP